MKFYYFEKHLFFEMVQMDDKKLVSDAKRDIGNFKYIYEKYLKIVYRYCYRRVGNNTSLAEDITSETFLRAIEKFESFEYKDKPFVVWLYSIAHNLIADHFRSKKENNVSYENLPTERSDDLENVLEDIGDEQLCDFVKECLPLLPSELLNIFTLRHTEDLSFKQIADLVGKSEGAVKMQYYRGLDELKFQLKTKKNM